MRILSLSSLLILDLLFFSISFSLSLNDSFVERNNADLNLIDANSTNSTGSFADMFDRALEKEFTENDQTEATDSGSFNNSVAEQQSDGEVVDEIGEIKDGREGGGNGDSITGMDLEIPVTMIVTPISENMTIDLQHSIQQRI